MAEVQPEPRNREARPHREGRPPREGGPREGTSRVLRGDEHEIAGLEVPGGGGHVRELDQTL